jgi:anaerobic ribonucleoside-triphosphate reductase activating protein
MLFNSQQINLADFAVANHLLGPGRRAIIWVQGCPRRCTGCITPHMQPFDIDREWVSPEQVAERVLDCLPLEGLTFVGGEPFSFAHPLSNLIRLIRQTIDISVVTYTGYTLSELRASPQRAWQDLLHMSDILIDGPYIEEEACDLLWRGSANQQMHFLTPRYASLASAITKAHGRLLEFSVNSQGYVRVIGIPEPGFFDRIDENLRMKGINLRFD